MHTHSSIARRSRLALDGHEPQIFVLKTIRDRLSRIIPDPFEPDDQGKLYNVETERGTRCANLGQCDHELREVAPHHFAICPVLGARPWGIDVDRIAAAGYGCPLERTGDDLEDFCRQLNSQPPEVVVTHSADGVTITGSIEGIAEPVQITAYWLHPDTPPLENYSTLDIDAGEWWTGPVCGRRGRDDIHHGDLEAEREYRRSFLAGIELLDRIDDIDEFGDACELLQKQAKHERYCVRHTESPLPVWNDVDTRCSLTSVELARTRGILHCLATALRRTDELFERGIPADTLNKTVDAWKQKVRSWAKSEPTDQLDPLPDLLDGVDGAETWTATQGTRK